jgi:HAD superfamily hydrolase (TIGR01509 family)
MQIEHILFDLGGVVLTHSKHLTPSMLEETFRISQDVITPWYTTQAVSWRKGILPTNEALMDLQRISKNTEPIEEIKKRYSELYVHYAQIDSEIISIIRNLKKHYHVHAWTNTVSLHYELNEARGLFTEFEQTFASCRMGIVKPEPEGFKYVANTLHATPSACLLVDDRDENIIGCHQNGFQGYMYTTCERFMSFLKQEHILEG